jgi:hypothetical protein
MKAVTVRIWDYITQTVAAVRSLLRREAKLLAFILPATPHRRLSRLGAHQPVQNREALGAYPRDGGQCQIIC